MKRQKVILDWLPFVYNIAIIIQRIFTIIKCHSNLTDIIAGFGLIVTIELFYRSRDNNYCFWHQLPVINMFLLCIFYVFDDNMNLSSDSNYIILYWMYFIFIFVFLLSALMFLRKKLFKGVKRCLKE